MALLLKSIAADTLVAPVGCIFGLDGKIGELSQDERLLRALLAEVKSQFGFLKVLHELILKLLLLQLVACGDVLVGNPEVL